VLDPQYLWLFGLLIGLGAFTQGFTGIGFGIIVLAGIAFTPWDFERATVVLNLLLLVLNGSIIYAGRKDSSINWGVVGYILLGEIIGVPLGYWFILGFGNQPVFRLVFGATLSLFAANELLRPRIRRQLNMAFGLFAGVVGGFLSGAFTAAGSHGMYFTGACRQSACLPKRIFENRIQLHPFGRPGECIKRPAVSGRYYAVI
jgi:uncharacterized membrane protein YfcA